MKQSPQVGDLIIDKSEQPTEVSVRDWLGEQAFEQWTELRNWIDVFYPGVFEPEWLYSGQKRGWSLRYKKTRAFCTLIPGYRKLSAVVVLGGVERDKFVDRHDFWRPQLIALYDDARTYPDGKFLTIAVSNAEDRKDVTELLTMKRPPVLS